MLFINQSGLIRTLIFLMGENDGHNLDHKNNKNNHLRQTKGNDPKVKPNSQSKSHDHSDHNHTYFNEEMYMIEQINHRVAEEIEEFKQKLALSKEKKIKEKKNISSLESKKTVVSARLKEMNEIEKRFINTDILLNSLQFRPLLGQNISESYIQSYKRNFFDQNSKFIVKTKRQKRVFFGLISEKIIDQYKFCNMILEFKILSQKN
jgi:hypothetical protein